MKTKTLGTAVIHLDTLCIVTKYDKFFLTCTANKVGHESYTQVVNIASSDFKEVLEFIKQTIEAYSMFGAPEVFNPETSMLGADI